MPRWQLRTSPRGPAGGRAPRGCCRPPSPSAGPAAATFAENLTALACTFALADFGTGHAALTYLKHLPISYLKIDYEFVADLHDHPRSRDVVAGVVSLAAQFGQQTIAEGVEDQS